MIERVAVVRHKNSYVFCRAAIGGAYYNAIGRFMDKDSAKKEVKGPQDKQIIVYFGPGVWVVTTKNDEDGIKTILAECRTRIAAESMIR